MADDRQKRGSAGGRSATTGLVVLASLVVILAGIKAAENLIVPFLLAVFIAVIVSPVMLWLCRRGVWPAAAVVLMVFVLLGIVVGLTSLIGSALNNFLNNMPEYERLLGTQIDALAAWLQTKGMEAPEQFLRDQVDPQALLDFTRNLLGGLSGMLGHSFMILLTVVFMLLEGSAFAAKLDALPEGLRGPAGQYREVVATIRRYIAVKTVISLITGALVAGLLFALHVEYPLLWGLLAFLLDYIPNIGSIIAAVPAVLLALVLNGLGTAVWVALGYLVINSVIGNIIEPRVMGKGMGLSALVVFLSLVFWGWLLGPVGMVLSVPLTMSVKIALSAQEHTRPIALLLGPAAPPPSAAPHPKPEPGDAS